MVLKLSLLRKPKKSYEYIIRHVFAWCPITKLNLRCIIEASLGSHGRPQLYTLRFSLVIRDRAKTCRIYYTNALVEKSFKMDPLDAQSKNAQTLSEIQFEKGSCTAR